MGKINGLILLVVSLAVILAGLGIGSTPEIFVVYFRVLPNPTESKGDNETRKTKRK